MSRHCEERSDEAIQETPAAPGLLRCARNDGGVSGASCEPLIQINQGIRRAGLVSRGALRLSEGERQGALADVATIVLIGTAGREGWSAFAAAPERADGAPHPLDRWSRRVIDDLARLFGGRALYPFDGPPYWPFQQWAMRAEPVHISPVGMLIHPEYGLWHSYRGALAFKEAFGLPTIERRDSPCETCVARPCLSSCPVGAFTNGFYDTARCAAHLRSEAGRDCMEGGCLARHACPIGTDHRPEPDQASFHMRAFLAARE